MAKKVISIEGKRPADATPEKALEYSKTLTQEQIGKLWGISRQRVQQLIKKARQAALLARAQQIAEENQNANDSLHD